MDIVEKENRIQETEETKKVKEYLGLVLREAFSPEWLQEASEECILEILPYLFNQTDQFTVSISAKDCIAPLHQAIQNSILDDEIFTFFYEKMVLHSAERLSKNMERDLHDIMSYVNKDSDPSTYQNIIHQEIETLLRKIYPQEELKIVLKTYLEQMADYFSGNSQDCILELETKKIVDVLKVWCENMLKKPEIYHYFFETTITNQILDVNSYKLPFDMRYNQEDLKVLYEVFPHSWFQKQAQNILNNTCAYLDKSVDSFSVTIDFTGYREKIISVLSKSFNAKLKKAWLSVEEGDVDYDSVLEDIEGGLLPLYRPINMSYEEFLLKANIQIEQLLTSYFSIEIWDKIEITHNAFKINDQDKEIYFSFEEFRKQTTQSLNEIPNATRLKKDIQKGIYFTESSLRNTRNIREIRQLFSYLPTVLFIGWGVAFILLAVISALCTDKSENTLVWALSILAFAALISFGALKTYEKIIFPIATEEIRQDIAGTKDPLEKISQEKAYSMISHGNDSIVHNMQNIILGILVFCILMIILYPALRSILLRKNDNLEMNDFPSSP